MKAKYKRLDKINKSINTGGHMKLNEIDDPYLPEQPTKILSKGYLRITRSIIKAFGKKR